jgi:predicted membrane protein
VVFREAGQEETVACDSKRFSWSLTFGLLVAAAGVILLLDQQGIIDANKVFQYFWPILCISFGLVNLFQPGRRRIWGVILLVIGVLLVFYNLGFAHIGFQSIWPVLIIVIGGLMIWQAIAPRTNPLTGQAASWREQLGRWGRNDSPESDFNQIAIFGGFKRRVTAKNFRGGNIMAVCGGYEIDLRKADIEGESATIDATSIMGGGEIKVPETWRISLDGMGVLGAYVDETHQIPPTEGTPQKHLIVKGIAFMGGVVVKN